MTAVPSCMKFRRIKQGGYQCWHREGGEGSVQHMFAMVYILQKGIKIIRNEIVTIH